MEKITIQTSIKADPEMVWDSYTNPRHITGWNFASDDWCCPRAENDMKVGGMYKARMEAKDGSWGFDFEAVYNEIDEPHRFVYTMPDHRQVEVKFEESAGSTEVIIQFDAESENPVDMQRDGWQAILNNFKKYTENLSGLNTSS